MPKISSICIYVLAFLLPVQTLIAQFNNNILQLPIWVNFWKEFLCLIIVLDLLNQYINKLRRGDFSQISRCNHCFHLLPLVLITLTTLIGAYFTLFTNKVPFTIFIVGFRFDLFWLWFFAYIATFLEYSGSSSFTKQFKFKFILAIYGGFSLVTAISFATIVLGQNIVLSVFGYGISKIGTYIVSAPICHVVDYGSEICRLSGSFSTPNHFAGYLFLVMPVFLSNIQSKQKTLRYTSIAFSFFALMFMVLSFARFALLGLAMSATVLIIKAAIKQFPKHKKVLNLGIVSTVFIAFIIGIIFINIDPEISKKYLPNSIAKPSSTVEHYRRSSASIDILSQKPEKLITGYGIGLVGPAGKPEYLNPSKNSFRNQWDFIAYKWYLVGEDLIIPENWYLQLVLSGGVLYTFMYLIMIAYPLKQKHIIYSLGFLSIILGNLFLHIWENQTITIYWSLLFIYTKLPSHFGKQIHT